MITTVQSIVGQAPSIITDKTTYQIGENIVFTLNNFIPNYPFYFGIYNPVTGSYPFGYGVDNTDSEGNGTYSLEIGVNVQPGNWLFRAEQFYAPGGQVIYAQTPITIVAQKQKLAEGEIYFIRLPFVTDEYIMNNLVSALNTTLHSFDPDLDAINPRLSDLGSGFWTCRVDIVGRAAQSMQRIQPMFGWLAIAVAFVAGAVIFGGFLIAFRIYPMKEALEEAGKTLDEIQEEIDEAVERGDITPSYADTLKKKIGEAAERAREAAKDPNIDWWKYLIEEVIPNLPIIIGGVAAIAAIIVVASWLKR